jgi:hypothetical protein
MVVLLHKHLERKVTDSHFEDSFSSHRKDALIKGTHSTCNYDELKHASTHIEEKYNITCKATTSFIPNSSSGTSNGV